MKVMLKFKALRSYRSSKGNTVFVSTVSGTKEEIAAYEAAQGDKFRRQDNKPDGAPLHFTTTFGGQSGNLIITASGKVIVDTSALDQAASLAKQYGGNLGTELAKVAAAQLLGGSNSSVTPTPIIAPAVKEELDPEDLDKM